MTQYAVAMPRRTIGQIRSGDPPTCAEGVTSRPKGASSRSRAYTLRMLAAALSFAASRDSVRTILTAYRLDFGVDSGGRITCNRCQV